MTETAPDLTHQLTPMMLQYRELKQRYPDLDGSPMHDPVCVAHLIDPTLLETRHLNVRVDCASELCRGRTVVDLWRRTGLEPNAHVAVGIDSERFLDLLHERLARLG